MPIKKDIEISSIVASKDTMIDKLWQDLQSLTQTMKDQKEDTECLLFAHWQSQRDLRDRMGSIIESKRDIIKRLHAKIVDQGEMCYKMLHEVNEHKRSAQLMKKPADDATKLSIACQQKKEAATETVQSLPDQFAQMQDKFTTLRKTSDKSKCRIVDLEEETMDLMDTIHVSN
jgi:hypothetical protein